MIMMMITPLLYFVHYSPIFLIAKYSHEDYLDGTRVAVCLTQASNTWTIIFFMMTISLFFLLPLIILIILYSIIAKNLISNDSSKLKIRLSKPEISLKARKQVVLMLGAVVLSFFACLLPFRLLTMWIIIVPDESFQGLNIDTYYILLYFCRIMLYLNSAINPILYNLMSSKFRKGFFKLFYRCFNIFRRIGIGGGKQNRNKSSANRNRTATFNTNTTTSSSYLAHQSSCYRKNSSCKMTLSLNDLSLQLQQQELNLIDSAAGNNPDGIATNKATSIIIANNVNDDNHLNSHKWYHVNLTRQFSTPTLLLNQLHNNCLNECTISAKGGAGVGGGNLRKIILTKNYDFNSLLDGDERDDIVVECHHLRSDMIPGRINKKFNLNSCGKQKSLDESLLLKRTKIISLQTPSVAFSNNHNNQNNNNKTNNLTSSTNNNNNNNICNEVNSCVPLLFLK